MKTQSDTTTAQKLPPDPEGMNEQRSEWAQIALAAYMAETGQEDKKEAIGDLVANIGHLCDRLGLNYAEILARSQRNHEEETLE